MGLYYSKWVFENASKLKLTSGQQLVLLSLADQMDKCGECWPSHAYTAGRVNLGVTQVRRHVQSLIKQGLISVIKNSKGGKPGQTPTYKAKFSPAYSRPKKTALTEERGHTSFDVPTTSHVSPQGLSSTTLDASLARDPNHHGIKMEPSVNQGAFSKSYEIPSNPRDWSSADYAAAAFKSGLIRGEYDKIESEHAFRIRTREAFSKMSQK